VVLYLQIMKCARSLYIGLVFNDHSGEHNYALKLRIFVEDAPTSPRLASTTEHSTNVANDGTAIAGTLTMTNTTLGENQRRK
jgi:hypothetical protein